MNESKRQSDVLSREELDALLASLAEDARVEEASPFRSGEPRSEDVPYPALRRALQQFAQDQTRRMSNVYQARIRYELMAWQEVSMAEALGRCLPSDRLAIFEVEPSAALGFALFGRPLLFALLSLNFGARPGGARPRIPRRPYTAIEERVLRGVARETLGQLDLAWKELLQTRSRVIAIDGPARLREDSHERVLLASFDVQGLGDVCRLRVGLPEAAFESIHAPSRVAQPARRAAVERTVTEMPVALRVELGCLDMTLSQLTGLSAGQVIPVRGADDGSLLVRVGGKVKFRGVRGSVGPKLAVQLTERL